MYVCCTKAVNFGECITFGTSCTLITHITSILTLLTHCVLRKGPIHGHSGRPKGYLTSLSPWSLPGSLTCLMIQIQFQGHKGLIRHIASEPCNTPKSMLLRTQLLIQVTRLFKNENNLLIYEEETFFPTKIKEEMFLAMFCKILMGFQSRI